MSPPKEADPAPTIAGRSELAKRIGAVSILIPVAVLAVWLGSWVFAAFAALCGVLILQEFLRMTQSAPRNAAVLAGGIALVAGGFAAMSMGIGVALALLAFGAFAAAVLSPASGKRSYAAGGVLYAGLPVVALVVLRRDDIFGLAAVLYLLCVVWATDTGGYIAGRNLGGPKLWPRVSPKKTWAGLVGGMVLAALVGLLTARLVGVSATAMVLLAAFLAVVAQAGDLFESGLKRRFQVKDSGTLIPGHGGVMDRLDGVVTAGVAAGLIGFARGGELTSGAGLMVW